MREANKFGGVDPKEYKSSTVKALARMTTTEVGGVGRADLVDKRKKRKKRKDEKEKKKRSKGKEVTKSGRKSKGAGERLEIINNEKLFMPKLYNFLFFKSFYPSREVLGANFKEEWATVAALLGLDKKFPFEDKESQKAVSALSPGAIFSN